jgi:hypothetical protein
MGLQVLYIEPSIDNPYPPNSQPSRLQEYGSVLNQFQ